MDFPELEKDIAFSPTFKEGGYIFKVFSVGERGTNMSLELMKEVVDGLVNATLKLGNVDSVVSVHVSGAMWALPVSLSLMKPLKLFTTEPNGDYNQRKFVQNRPYLKRFIYAPDLQNAKKCVIIDDVLSEGGTITQLKAEIEQSGGTVVGVVVIIDKMGKAPRLSLELGVPVVGLVRGSSY